MIKKGIVLLINLLAGFLILAILLAAIPGHASSNQQRGQGEVVVTGDYQVAVSFELDEQTPDRIREVSLEVLSMKNLDPTAEIQISLDEGNIWHKCTFVGGKIWKCVFQPADTPMVEKVNTVKVVIQS